MRLTDLILKTRTRELIRVLTKKERIFLVGASFIFIITLIIYALLAIQLHTHAIPTRGGEYTEGIVGQPVFINPVMPVTIADRDISSIVFSSVYEVSDSIRRNDDGNIWNVRLKENAVWHDGEKITSDDIIFTLETIQDPDSRSQLAASFRGVAVERISQLEVQFVLRSPYAFFKYDHLRALRIIPKHIFADIPVQNIRMSGLGLRPIGSGPYKITSFEKGDDGIITSIKLDANKKYFNKVPFIQELTFKFYREIGDVIRAYNLAQIDGFAMSTAEPLTENSIRVRNRTHHLTSPRYYAVFINQSLAPKEFRDINTRKALSAVIDRDRIINEVFISHATPAFGPTKKSVNPAKKFNTELLQDLEVNLTVPEERFLIKTAQILKENWESYGANVTVDVFPLKSIRDEVLRNSDYQLILFGNITKEHQDLFAFWHSSQRFYPDQNLALYYNDTVDTLLEDFRRTFNADERREKLTKISNLITKDVPALFLYSPRHIYITTTRLGGFDEGMTINTSADRFSNIEGWFLNTRRVLSGTK